MLKNDRATKQIVAKNEGFRRFIAKALSGKDNFSFAYKNHFMIYREFRLL